MAHHLVPRAGQQYLSPRSVVTRLLSEFSYVASSEEDGRRHVRAIIKELHTIRQRGDIPVDDQYLDRLEKAERDAIYVYFGDWDFETPYLGTAVIPGEPIFFSFSSHAHAEAAKTMLMRCAETLHYEVRDA